MRGGDRRGAAAAGAAARCGCWRTRRRTQRRRVVLLALEGEGGPRAQPPAQQPLSGSCGGSVQWKSASGFVYCVGAAATRTPRARNRAGPKMPACVCVRACVRAYVCLRLPAQAAPARPTSPAACPWTGGARKRVGFGMIPNAGNTKQKQQLLWVGGCWGLTLSEIRQNSPLLLTLRTGRTHSGAAGGPRRETAPAARGPPLLLFEVGGYKKTKCR